MKLLTSVLVFVLFDFSLSQSISCNFVLNNGTYQCNLIVANLNGVDNFESVPGEHVDGFDNADVVVVRRFMGLTSNVPRIICKQFGSLEVNF
jgi:hypothetical protein